MMDVAQLRLETPACESVLHFNNAGASLMPKPVFDQMQHYITEEYETGACETQSRHRAALDAFYTELGALLNAAPEEIAYVENATRAWDMVFYGLKLQRGDRIITHGSEYASNFLAFLQQSRRHGFEIDVAPSDETGQVDVGALEALITPRTRLIAITHVPTQSGLINPAAEIGAVARRHGVFYMLDACQSVGQVAVDVCEIGCDALTGTGRKYLRGPRGTGFLFVAKRAIERIDPPFIDIESATWTGPDSFEYAAGTMRFENWESHVAGRIGLAAAVRYARAVGIEAIERRLFDLASELRDALGNVAGVTLHDLGQKKGAIVTFRKAELAPHAAAERLLAQGINVSVSTQSYALLDLGSRNLDAVIRASVHYYNTNDEIERFVRAVEQL